jgi:hypothetical protein
MDTLNDYNQLIISQILSQMNQISTNLQKFQKLSNSIEENLPVENVEFSRVDTGINIKCNFCTKISYYQDTNNKYYCWFHRSQYE